MCKDSCGEQENLVQIPGVHVKARHSCIDTNACTENTRVGKLRQVAPRTCLPVNLARMGSAMFSVTSV